MIKWKQPEFSEDSRPDLSMLASASLPRIKAFLFQLHLLFSFHSKFSCPSCSLVFQFSPCLCNFQKMSCQITRTNFVTILPLFDLAFFASHSEAFP